MRSVRRRRRPGTPHPCNATVILSAFPTRIASTSRSISSYSAVFARSFSRAATARLSYVTLHLFELEFGDRLVTLALEEQPSAAAIVLCTSFVIILRNDSSVTCL